MWKIYHVGQQLRSKPKQKIYIYKGPQYETVGLRINSVRTWEIRGRIRWQRENCGNDSPLQRNECSFHLRVFATTRKKRSGCCNTDENRIQQCFAAHIVHSCQQYWTILLHPIQAQQYCSILLTSVNNVGSKTLFNPVEQRVRRFLPCSEWRYPYSQPVL